MHKYIAMIIFLYVTGSILGGILEDVYLSGTTEQSTISKLTSWEQVNSEEDSTYVFEVGKAITGALGAVFSMLTFDYAFITGDWELFRWIVLAPMMGLIAWLIISTFLSLFTKNL